jgi:hypothetical protein
MFWITEEDGESTKQHWKMVIDNAQGGGAEGDFIYQSEREIQGKS